MDWPEALLLDFDGTLLDTEPVLLRTWQEEYRRHGWSLAEQTWVQGMGSQAVDHYKLLAELVGPSFDATACRSRRRAAQEAGLANLSLRPGMVGLLGAAAVAAVPVAVVSSSPRSWVEGQLGLRQALGRVTLVVGREDGLRAKPAPDLYLEAVRRLGVPPDRALALEDAANGVAAATSAGIRCLAVPNALTTGQDFAGAVAEVQATEQLTASILLLWAQLQVASTRRTSC